MSEENIQDALTVHKFLKAKFLAEYYKSQMSLYEEYFIFLDEKGKPDFSTTDLDKMLDYITEKYGDGPGYYTS